MQDRAGTIFLDNLRRLDQKLDAESVNEWQNYADALECVGSCLCALHRISTCSNGCSGGDHTFQYFAGRAFNLSYASYRLIRLGLYDEALNLLRSLGELGNLLALSLYDTKSFEKWMTASDSERIRNLGPAWVRTSIKKRKDVR